MNLYVHYWEYVAIEEKAMPQCFECSEIYVKKIDKEYYLHCFNKNKCESKQIPIKENIEIYDYKDETYLNK